MILNIGFKHNFGIKTISSSHLLEQELNINKKDGLDGASLVLLILSNLASTV